MKSPPEWNNDYYYKEIINKNINDVEKGLINYNSRTSPIITVPHISQIKPNSLSKDFTYDIDIEFKTRSGQLSNVHFKDMPLLLKVNDTDITQHYIPGFTTTENNLNSKPRQFDKISKKNEFGFDRTETKGIKIVKLNPQDVIDKVEQKNKFNNYKLDSNRESNIPGPITPIIQRRSKHVAIY